jgi:hypothetical protein
MVSNNRIVVAAVVSGIGSIGCASAQSAQTEHPINSVREIHASLRACWISPAMGTRPQVTVRLSFKRNGEILGRPLISYVSPDISEDERTALHAAVAAAVARCTPPANQWQAWWHNRWAPDQCEAGRRMEAERSADSPIRQIVSSGGSNLVLSIMQAQRNKSSICSWSHISARRRPHHGPSARAGELSERQCDRRGHTKTIARIRPPRSTWGRANTGCTVFYRANIG